jgi:hypothetical protein
VIGVGVKNSTSDLLVANCDEFIFYDDLVREKKTVAGRKKASAKSAPANAAKSESSADEEKTEEALKLVMGTVEALLAERGPEDRIWGSMVKQALKRRKPGFNESYYGFASFSKLLDEARARHLLVLEEDEKSGGYIIKSAAPQD